MCWDYPGKFLARWAAVVHIHAEYVDLCWIDSQLLQHIYRPIAAHLLHYCSMFKILLQHIYGTIRAHLPHHYSIFNYSNIAEHKIQIIYLGGKLLYWCYLFEGLIENGKVKESCITWHDLLQPMRYPTCDEMIKIDHVKHC